MNNKRFLTLATAILLAASLAVPAMAADSVYPPSGADISVEYVPSNIVAWGSQDSVFPSGGARVAGDSAGSPGVAALVEAALENDENYVRIRESGVFGISQDELAAFDGLRAEFDSVAGGAVEVRVTLETPDLFEDDLMVSGATSGSQVDRVKASFEKIFVNDLRVVHLDQAGEWGMTVQISAKLDLEEMDTDNLWFYSYDAETNKYKRIYGVEYRVDGNGYLVFTTDLAGDIVVSDLGLYREGEEPPEDIQPEEPAAPVYTAPPVTETADEAAEDAAETAEEEAAEEAPAETEEAAEAEDEAAEEGEEESAA